MRRHRIILAVVLVALPACEREERPEHAPSSGATAVNTLTLTDLHAGSVATQPGATRPSATQPEGRSTINAHYENNAWAMNDGKKLFESFNCVGCHAHGGGDKGPPLMDDKWIYGSRPEQIFASIVEGRPNGMPAFRGRIPDYQVWQIVAYVRSLSGQVNKNAAPGRDDHMQTGQPPNSTPTTQPNTGSVPHSAEMPE